MAAAMATLHSGQKQLIHALARIGLVAKGIVYVALGALAFMAAFEFAGHSKDETTRTGVFQWLQKTGGSFLLWLITAGLVCYCIWRFVQTFTGQKNAGRRIRFLFSGLGYASVAFTALSLALHKEDNGNQNQYWVATLLSKPLGVVLVAIAALVFAAVGLYQLYYAYSGKYKKHVEGLYLADEKARFLLRTGKMGYLARGLVWLLLSFLLARAAIYHKASEAGDTSKAFTLLEGESYGSFILGCIGVGLMAYGVFSMVRARYEHFTDD